VLSWLLWAVHRSGHDRPAVALTGTGAQSGLVPAPLVRAAKIRSAVVLLIVSGLGSALASCATRARTGELIDRFKAAECVPVKRAVRLTDAPEWHTTLTTREGTEVRLSGRGEAGGGIGVTYPDGRTVVAAKPADYIYPADVRFDPRTDRLYTKASGLPAFSLRRRAETWLFEYDVDERRETGRLLVAEGVLEPECDARQ
jgi:hypothetical protein